ncbi:MAG: methyltransferase domain-containing protein [Betaproteobacteria bacterium]|nr:methyltransferase domain-containing protein [Betaproteobacteria bacterium]
MESNTPLDTTAAEAYEQFIVPALNAPLAADAVELAAPRPGERLLDVACGTGIVVRIAAPRVAPGGSIAGLDIDPAMIAVARSLVRGPDGVTLHWHCASAQDMPFASATFDVALCLQGLQYLPSCVAGLAEIRRVMKPGGRLVALVWSSLEDCKGQHALARALERRNVDAAAILKAYSLGDSDGIRALAAEAGFRDVEIRASYTTARFASVKHFVEAFAAGSLSSRAAISKVPEHQRSGFLEDIDRALRQYEDGNGVALPLGYLVMIARP